MSTLNRLFVEKLGGSESTTFIGSYGEIFYNPATGALRLSNGSTVGGVALAVEAVPNEIYSQDLIPSLDNMYSLGSPQLRWKSVHVGPGSVWLHDVATAQEVELTLDAGVLKINGSNQLQVGQLKFIDNTIESTTPAVDISIGLTASTANLVLNRNVIIAEGKTFTFNNAVGYQDGNQTPQEILDLTKQVHTFADGHWTLPDGLEGQVMHFVMLPGGSAEDIYVQVAHLRKNVGGMDTTVTNQLLRPFPYAAGPNLNTLTTAIFVGAAWHFSQGEIA